MFERVLEKEIMETQIEAEDYDRIAKIYFLFMSRPVVKEIIKISKYFDKRKEINILDVGGAAEMFQLKLQRKLKIPKFIF